MFRFHQVSIIYRLCEILQFNKSITKSNQVDSRGDLVMAEVGVRNGETSQILLQYFPNLHMHLIDVWDNKRHYRTLKKRIEPFRDRVTLHKALSSNAVNAIADLSLDLCFIDADHSYEAVKSDIGLYSLKVKQTGYMGGHDIDDKNFPGVRKAVEEAAKLHSLNMFTDMGHTWWYHNSPNFPRNLSHHPYDSSLYG